MQSQNIASSNVEELHLRVVIKMSTEDTNDDKEFSTEDPQEYKTEQEQEGLEEQHENDGQVQVILSFNHIVNQQIGFFTLQHYIQLKSCFYCFKIVI